jgi:kynurenine formamidase
VTEPRVTTPGRSPPAAPGGRRPTGPATGSAPAADWLARQRVSLVAVDNWGCDVHPSPVPGQFFPVHQRLLTMAGIYILENIRTSDLVRAAASAPFLFILGVPRLQGATAAVVAPLAVL